MSFTHSTTVVPCNEYEVGDMPQVKYNFVPLKSILETSPDENIGKNNTLLLCATNYNIN